MKPRLSKEALILANAMLQNERRQAPIVTSSLGKRGKVSPVRIQPCPPSTSWDKDRHAGDTFRERKFKGEYHTYRYTLSSEGNSSRKREEYTGKRSKPKTITVYNFQVDLPSSAMRPITVSDVEYEFEETLASEDYKVKNNIQEESDMNISNCIQEVSKGITVSQTTRLTIRKQANSFVDCKRDRNRLRTVCKVTQYCVLHKEKRAMVPSPPDGFARRQLGCNLKLRRENLELNESFAPKTCKDFDTRKEMINNWLIGIPRVK